MVGTFLLVVSGLVSETPRVLIANI